MYMYQIDKYEIKTNVNETEYEITLLRVTLHASQSFSILDPVTPLSLR